jgi:fatty-acid desaturase
VEVNIGLVEAVLVVQIQLLERVVALVDHLLVLVMVEVAIHLQQQHRAFKTVVLAEVVLVDMAQLNLAEVAAPESSSSHILHKNHFKNWHTDLPEHPWEVL